MANVDRKAIKLTVDFILNDEKLSNIFENILPAGTLLKNIAKNLGLGVIEIEVGEENIGILANASKIISRRRYKYKTSLCFGYPTRRNSKINNHY